ncbi:transcriptional regulator [Afipia sp. Root123D2]|uniref:Copper-sensing transcriptional repressor CsoR family protein n=1 Tax=Rhodopseudomonas palustris TaxID=1076 RepID=A0A0D7E6L6_RHOPL|nr:copper-sensing transcriptional repressor CsoR family protein [Rhodopseudomonas palustris]KQW18116.1 transcriptional regulator [Afipia sp. Root123D2]
MVDAASARTKAKVNRFNRIAGQVQGIARMVQEGRYCIDVLQQIQAVKTALARAEGEVLRDHAANCVAHAISTGDKAEQREKVDEIVALFDRARR